MHSLPDITILWHFYAPVVFGGSLIYRIFLAVTIFIKGLIIALLVFVLFSLGSALYFLVRDPAKSTRVVKALTWRISLSIILFLLLMFAFKMGWITPHSLKVGG